MISKYIKSVGFELECGVNEDYEKFKKLRENERFEVGFDESVRVSGCYYSSMEFKFWSENLKEIWQIGRILWEKLGILQNQTCGNHFHFRFTDEVKDGVFWQDFIKKFFEEYKKNFKEEKYLERLNNPYCRANSEDYVERFLDNCDLSRYKAVNFLSFGRHKTLEIRVMPYAKNFKEWKRQLLFEIKFINNYFKKFKKIEKIEIKEEKLNKKIFYLVENLRRKII